MKNPEYIPFWFLILAALVFWLRVPEAHAASCLSAYTTGGRTYYILNAAATPPNCAVNGGVLYTNVDYTTINNNFLSLNSSLSTALSLISTNTNNTTANTAAIASLNSQFAAFASSVPAAGTGSALLPPLTVSEGVVIGSALLLVWAIAFGFRILRKPLSTETEGD